MAIADSDMELYLGHQRKTDSIDEQNRLFKLKVDTITTHGGTPGHHPEQVKQILERKMKNDNIIPSEYENMDPEDKTDFN